MRRSPILEKNQDSLSLNDNTVVHIYNDLQSSNEHNGGQSSSNEHSLSRQQFIELKKMNQTQQNNALYDQEQLPNPIPYRNKQFRGSVRPIRNIENKYDFGISPSTKEEQSILRAVDQLQRKGNPNPSKGRSKLQNIDSDPYASDDRNERSEREWEADRQESSQKQSVESGRRGKLGSQRKKAEFDINSFLNAEPMRPKDKRGISLFKNVEEMQKHMKKDSSKRVREKSMRNHSNIVNEDTINLITLPEVEYGHNMRLCAAMERGQRQLQKLNGGYQRRFKQARLNFLDQFLPAPLKIKNNAYNLLKYITNPIR